jgi:ribosome-associated toxin RatA of RatAB toxin-antitoxin module
MRHGLRRFLFLLGWSCLASGLLCAQERGPARVEVLAQAQGDGVAVQASATVDCPPELVWATLTDYDNLPKFIPGLRASKVLSREGNKVVVEQHGEAGLFFLSHEIKVVVVATEQPPGHIDLTLRSGNLKQLSGSYRINSVEGGVLLTWSGVIEPELSLPSFFEVRAMRRNIETQFIGMVREIERREAQRRKKPQ